MQSTNDTCPCILIVPRLQSRVPGNPAMESREVLLYQRKEQQDRTIGYISHASVDVYHTVRYSQAHDDSMSQSVTIAMVELRIRIVVQRSWCKRVRAV